jgi:hypothetical protein
VTSGPAQTVSQEGIPIPGQMKPWKHQERVPFNVIVDVFTRSSESIELERLVVRASPSSLSAMKIDPVNRQINIVIPPGQVRTVDLWLSTWVELPNLDGGNQTTLRVTAYFETELGRFRRVYNLPILEPASRAAPTPH